MAKTQINLRLSTELKNKIEKIAEKNQRSVNSQLRKMIQNKEVQ